jgi:lipopolysaccharide export system permease protein
LAYGARTGLSRVTTERAEFDEIDEQGLNRDNDRVKIIGRYILKEHVGPFLFASTALTSLMLLQYIAKRFGDLVGKGLPASVITEFLLLSVPFTVAMTMPMAVLVAVLYAFSRLAAENEVTALKASGVGMRTVLLPVIGFGFVMSLIMLAFNDQVLPAANHRLAVLQLDIFRTKPTFALREQVINTVKEGQLYLKAGDIDEATSEMKDVVIYDLSDPLRRRTIYADHGRLEIASNQKDLQMTLFDGVMMEVPNKKPSELTRLFYRQDRMRVKNIFSSFQESQTGTISKGDREMSVCEMQHELARHHLLMLQANHDKLFAQWEGNGRRGTMPETPTLQPGRGVGGVYCMLLTRFAVNQATAAPVQAPQSIHPGGTARDTTAFATPDSEAVKARVQDAEFRMTDARRQRDRYDVEIQKKFSLAAACVVFVLIGAPIALRFPRGGVGLVIGVSFVIFGLYYVGLIGGEALADRGYLPPWFAMWLANIILLIVGLMLAARMGRESATTRGGDFGELLVTARAKSLGWLRRFGVNIERRR